MILMGSRSNVGSESKAFFTGYTTDTIDISSVASSPTTLSGVGYDFNDSLGFEWIEEYGAVKNTSGREILSALGFITFQLEQSGGSDTLYFWSEISLDNGATWTFNTDSLRKVEVSSSNEALNSYESNVANFPDQALGRFRFYNSTADISFQAPSITLNSVPMSGKSLIWSLQED